MAKISKREDPIADAIDEHHAEIKEAPRPHMGASGLGHHCDRWIWLSFRWAVREKFPGRIKRLFRRGHNEEATIQADLEAIGVKFQNTGADQEYVNLGGHLGGSTDGIALSGIPGGGMQKHVVEYKTHALKSFNDLLIKGVKDSKPAHFAQMQLYMHGLGIKRALYVAVCKNDDRLYTERLEYDAEAAEALLSRGKRLSTAERMPDPISTDASWYQCKMCPAHDFCHGSKLTKQINCRTCARSTPTPDGKWGCARWDENDVAPEHQEVGCEAHVLHPDLVPWSIKDSNHADEAVYEIDGKDVRNGEPDAFTFSSAELISSNGDVFHDIVIEARKVFPGSRITGVIETDEDGTSGVSTTGTVVQGEPS